MFLQELLFQKKKATPHQPKLENITRSLLLKLDLDK